MTWDRQWSTKGLKEIGMYVYIRLINREVIFTVVLFFSDKGSCIQAGLELRS